MLSLTCAVQNYDWGITGVSEVAALGALNTGVAADPTLPYAELWMGTHPSGPSIVKASGAGLKETIAADAATHLGRGGIEIQHSTDVERLEPSLPPPRARVFVKLF